MYTINKKESQEQKEKRKEGEAMNDYTGIKEGDEIYLWTAGFNPIVSRVRVTKITPTQIVVRGTRFHRTTGHVVGNTRSHLRIKPINEENTKQFLEVRNEMYERRVRRDLAAVQWDSIPIEKVRVVAAIVFEQGRTSDE